MSAAVSSAPVASARVLANDPASPQSVAVAATPVDAGGAAPFLATLCGELAAAAQQVTAQQPGTTPDATATLPALADAALHLQLAQSMASPPVRPAAREGAAASQPGKDAEHDLPEASALLLQSPMTLFAETRSAVQAPAARQDSGATIESAPGRVPATRNQQAVMQLAMVDTAALETEAGSERRPQAAVDAVASFARTALAEPAPRVQDAVVKLPAGDSAQWRQPLAQALGDRLEVMRSHASDTAVIRLDPPMMGRVEISIRHEPGALKVSITATHGEVLRQLQGIGESLRADLSQRQFSDVTVQVTDSAASRFAQGDSEGRQRQPQADQGAPGRSLAEAESGHEADVFRVGSDQE